MYSIITLSLFFLTMSYALPQFPEDYRQQYADSAETSEYEGEEPGPKRISLVPERGIKAPIKVYKFLQPQQASVQEDQYRQTAEDRYSTPIPILKYDKTQSLDGSYKASYETGNNIIAEETGFIKNIGVKDQEALVQQGSFSYTAPDGTLISTSYTADEGGFRVEGSHLPTPPPIPEEIRKALEVIYEGIKQQQEAEARDAKYGKTRPGSVEETNSVSDNYPIYA